jgi:hypothetical protein
MIESHVHLAYAPRGPGLLYAVMWFADRADVYGWFIGERDGGYLASYFMLEHFYARAPTRLYRSAEDDPHGVWLEGPWRRERPLPEPPVPQALRHDLSRLQDEFIRHWLFFGGEPGTEDEAKALNARELAVRTVNIRPSHLNRLRTAAAVWRYDSTGADLNVLAHLSQHWPLEHRLPA